jgi:hypothetical protein
LGKTKKLDIRSLKKGDKKLSIISHIEVTVNIDVLFYDICKFSSLILFGILIFFLYRQRNKMEKEALPFLISLILYFFLELISLIFLYLYNRLTGFNTDLNIPNYVLWGGLNMIGLLLTMVGPVYLIYILEQTFFKKKILKEKHIITILQLIIISILIVLVITGIIIFNNLTDTLAFFSSLLDLGLILFLGIIILQFSIFYTGFLFLGIKSSGSFRKYSLLISNGYFLRGLTNLLALGTVDNLQAGTYQFNTNFFYIHMGIYDLLQIPWVLLLFYGLLKLYSLEEIKVESEEIKEFLHTFVRPKKITEEEVTFYKEQKICMVCKGKAIGFNIFVCSKCDALYCKKCAKQLSNLENACWACNEPFDSSKPSSPFKTEEEKKIKEELEVFKEGKNLDI